MNKEAAIAKSTKARAEKLFKELDVNGSGQLDAEELATAMNSIASFKRLCGPGGINMKEMDVNGNGKLSMMEFVLFFENRTRVQVAAGLANEAQLAAMIKQAKHVFDSVDTNGDGQIDGTELAKGLRVNKGLQKLVQREVTINEIVSSDLDANRDNKVSFDEFVQFIQAETAKAEAPVLQAAVQETLDEGDLGSLFD